MNRALALIAGLLLATQVVAAPVLAADTNTAGTIVPAQDQRPPVSPLTPSHPKTEKPLSAVPTPDLKVEFVSHLVGDVSQTSKFRITNVGKAIAKSPQAIPGCLFEHSPDYQELHETYASVPLNDLAPGQSAFAEVNCFYANEGKGLYLLANTMSAKVSGDPVEGNNFAKDPSTL